MINADNIGKRIRALRKQKNISQEKMALDLGLYQADISNLERAMSGSGIQDLGKLDMIADYFGISLVELLIGFNPEEQAATSEIKKTEVFTMENFTLKAVYYTDSDETHEDVCCTSYVSELKLESTDGKTIFVSFCEIDGKPWFLKSTESLYEELRFLNDEKSLNKDYKSKLFITGNDYVDIFENTPKDCLKIIRLLIFLATEHNTDKAFVSEFIENNLELQIRDIQVPVPEREPEAPIDVDFSDLSVVYRYRLMIETILKKPSVWADMDGGLTTKQYKNILLKLKEACTSEEAYKVWKKDLIDAKVNEVTEKMELVRISYLFAGVGSYVEILPKDEVECFYEWIRCNGSAFAGEPEPATKRDIRTFVSEHIADNLLGVESPLN